MMGYNFEVEPSVAPSEIATEAPILSEEPTRNVYDGDISTTILDKFGAYYIRESRYFEDLDYLIVRSSQYDYYMYIGKMNSDHSFTGVTKVCHYYGRTTGGYSGYTYYWDVTESTSPTVDVGGSDGYIYSSYSSYLANPYIVSTQQAKNTSYICLALTLGIFAVAIFLWIKNIWEVVHHEKK